MFKTYCKQTWQMMKQHRLFTGIYVVGTALAIATTTAFAIIYYVKIAPVYPETQRNDTYYFSKIRDKSESGWFESRLSYNFLKNKIYNVKNADVTTAWYDNWQDFYVDKPDKSRQQVVVKAVDNNWWDIFKFDFKAGRPFGAADFESGSRTAVITEPLADKLFGREDAEGESIILNHVPYRVSGVIKPGSGVNYNSFADIYIPYTSLAGYDANTGSDFAGNFIVFFKAKDGDALKAEVDEIIRVETSSNPGHTLEIWKQPMPHMLNAFMYPSDEDFSWWDVIKEKLIVFLVLLIVPALNLSGMISSRMDMRSAELGIRKSFGATRGVLLRQVLWENLLLTLVGGVLGLVLTWIFINATSDWLFSIFDTFPEEIPGGISVTTDMFFAPVVFIFSFLVCVVLNLLSGLIPAWRSLKHPIVSSLKEKQ